MLTPGDAVTLFGDLLGLADAGPAVVAAAECGKEDVFGAPHHTLRHARGAAGVEDVEIVGRARAETVAIGRRRRERLLVVDRAEPVGLRVRGVVELDEMAELGDTGKHRSDVRAELRFEDQRDEIGIVEQVPQLVDDVAVVHVDGNRRALKQPNMDSTHSARLYA